MINCSNDNDKYIMLRVNFVKWLGFYAYKRIQQAWESPNKRTKRCGYGKKLVVYPLILMLLIDKCNSELLRDDPEWTLRSYFC